MCLTVVLEYENVYLFFSLDCSYSNDRSEKRKKKRWVSNDRKVSTEYCKHERHSRYKAAWPKLSSCKETFRYLIKLNMHTALPIQRPRNALAQTPKT